MLCVSETGRLKIYVRSEQHELAPNGAVARVIPRLWVEFLQGGGIPDYAREKALARFEFAALPIGLDPMERLGWFDTNLFAEDRGLSDADKQFLEEWLRAHDGEGYIIAEPPRVAAPWPSYDQLTVQGRRTLEFIVDKIRERVTEDGYSPAAVAAYEEQNLARPQVLAMLADLQAVLPEVEPEPLVAA